MTKSIYLHYFVTFLDDGTPAIEKYHGWNFDKGPPTNEQIEFVLQRAREYVMDNLNLQIPTQPK